MARIVDSATMMAILAPIAPSIIPIVLYLIHHGLVMVFAMAMFTTQRLVDGMARIVASHATMMAILAPIAPSIIQIVLYLLSTRI
jgi:hypothetical protein